MPKYVLVMDQVGNGCDYTIGCGINYELIDAANIEEARAKAEDIWCGNPVDHNGEFIKATDIDDSPYGSHSDTELERMLIAEYIEYCPLSKWEEQAEENKNAGIRAKREAEEREELKRLQAKYGRE